jgi:hypothetical protein
VVIKTKFILPKKHTQSNLVKPFNDYKYTIIKKRFYESGFPGTEMMAPATLPEY